MQSLAVRDILIVGFVTLWTTLASACPDDLRVQAAVPPGFSLVAMAPAVAAKPALGDEVVRLAQQLHTEGERTGLGGVIAFSRPYLDKILEQDKRSQYSQLILAPDGRVAAFTLSDADARWSITPKKADVEIHKLGVLPEFRRRGLALVMLAMMALRARDRKKENLSLNVFSTNGPALEVYDRMGFYQVHSGESIRPPARVLTLHVHRETLWQAAIGRAELGTPK